MADARGNARIHASLERPVTAYSRDLFGHFIEHFHRQVYGGIFEPGSPLSDARGFRTDVIEALRELRPGVVRWPGGCFASSYHWLEGVGAHRTASYDKAWRVSEPNSFGTHEFVDWCQEIGAAPYICTNAGTGTAEEMSDWLEYCNLSAGGRWAEKRADNGSPAPLNVPFWSIGNENYGSWEMGAKDPVEWARLVAESAKMMLRTDESITLLTAARADLEWTLPLLELVGEYLDMVSIHGYWDPVRNGNDPASYVASMARSLEPEQQIRRMEQIIGAAGLEGRVAIAFDEWNLRAWHHPAGNSRAALNARDLNDDNSIYTMADAVFSASLLNSCLRHADTVKMANIAPSVNTRGPLYVHPDGIVRRTTFHVLQMYANLLGSHVADVAIDSDSLSVDGRQVPRVDAIGTTNDDADSISFVLVNRDPDQDAVVEVQLGAQPVNGTFFGWVLAGDSTDAYNDLDNPDRVSPLQSSIVFENGLTTVAPHSISVFTIKTPDRRVPAMMHWSLNAKGDWTARR